jgi:hypothetical protein
MDLIFVWSFLQPRKKTNLSKKFVNFSYLYSFMINLKRYAVFNPNGSLSELKGFELKV